MIKHDNPVDQIDASMAALRTLECALETLSEGHFATTALNIEWSLKDAFDRLEKKHKEELDCRFNVGRIVEGVERDRTLSNTENSPVKSAT